MHQQSTHLETKSIDEDCLYSAREALPFFENIKSEPSLRKFILEDAQSGNTLNAKIITRGKQQRFFIKGSNIINFLLTT